MSAVTEGAAALGGGAGVGAGVEVGEVGAASDAVPVGAAGAGVGWVFGAGAGGGTIGIGAGFRPTQPMPMRAVRISAVVSVFEMFIPYTYQCLSVFANAVEWCNG